MAKQSSFDVVSELDMQEVDNAVNQALQEVSTRYDLKSSGTTLTLDRKAVKILMESANDFTLKSTIDVLTTKAIKRGISAKALHVGNIEQASMGRARTSVELVTGLTKEKAKEITKFVKDTKLRADVAIEGEKIRVSAKSKDVLQEVMGLLKAHDFDVPLQFVNYR